MVNTSPKLVAYVMWVMYKLVLVPNFPDSDERTIDIIYIRKPMALSHGKSETSQEKRHGKPCDSPGIPPQDPQRPGTPEMEVTISPMEPVRTRRRDSSLSWQNETEVTEPINLKMLSISIYRDLCHWIFFMGVVQKEFFLMDVLVFLVGLWRKSWDGEGCWNAGDP